MFVKIRKARIEESRKLMEIINEAKAALKSSGVDQWQDGYPKEETIWEDIRAGASYLLETDAGDIAATASISHQKEPTYEKIYEGEWLSSDSYLVIHRIAVREQLKRCGYAAKLLNYAEELASEKQIESIRIDTHKDNQPMQRFLERQGFQRCGVIFLADGSERLAYEKLENIKI